MADYKKIEAAFQERGKASKYTNQKGLLMSCLIDARIKRLTEDLSRVNSDMNMLREEISHILKLKDKKVSFKTRTLGINQLI
jgi:hypothetical protein